MNPRHFLRYASGQPGQFPLTSSLKSMGNSIWQKTCSLDERSVRIAICSNNWTEGPQLLFRHFLYLAQVSSESREEFL